MSNADDIHVIDGQEYLPEQKPSNVWTTFNPNSGRRHLQGYYMDHDEIISRLNFLKKINI